MIIKIGAKAKIASVSEDIARFDDTIQDFHVRTASSSIRLNPSKYLYIRNHSVHALETHGPNGNHDGMPRAELMARHYTFANSPVSIDHQSDKPNAVIGVVLDTAFIPLTYTAGEKVKYVGDYVTNVLAVSKEAADHYQGGLVQNLLDGKITDTSMGCLVGYSTCAICNHVASTEDDYCVHIREQKGQLISVGGMEKKAYEICHNVSFFEDSIILPAHLGGVAGGAGADPYAKIVQRYANKSIDKAELARAVVQTAQKLEASLNSAQAPLFDEFVTGFTQLLDESNRR